MFIYSHFLFTSFNLFWRNPFVSMQSFVSMSDEYRWLWRFLFKNAAYYRHFSFVVIQNVLEKTFCSMKRSIISGEEESWFCQILFKSATYGTSISFSRYLNSFGENFLFRYRKACQRLTDKDYNGRPYLKIQRLDRHFPILINHISFGK